MSDEELRADLTKLQNRDMGVAIGRNYVEALLEEMLELRAANAHAFMSGLAVGQVPNLKLALANVPGLLRCIAALDDAGRQALYVELHGLYCRHCGSAFTDKHPTCHCENDE